MIVVPNGVEVLVEENSVRVKGKLGSVSKNFPVKGLKIEKKEEGIEVNSLNAAIVNTVSSVIASMVKGVSEGYAKKMVVVYSHFPISVEVKGKTVSIKNFLGEKKPREAAIAGDTKVQAKGSEVLITGIDKEHVNQTISNLKTATKIRNKDSRVFQDGLYVVEE